MAKNFFSSLGEAFVKLLKGDLQGVKDVFADLGAESSAAFNNATAKGRGELAKRFQENRRKELQAEITNTENILAERKARGQETFNIELRNLNARIQLAKNKQESFRDLELERIDLVTKRNQAISDAEKAQTEKEKAAKAKADADAAAAEIKAIEEAAAIRERNAEASFARSQLLRETELAALEADTNQSLLILQEAANLRLEILQNERDKELENLELTDEEKLLIADQFKVGKAEIERQRLQEIADFEAAKVAAEQATADEISAIDEDGEITEEGYLTYPVKEVSF